MGCKHRKEVPNLKTQMLAHLTTVPLGHQKQRVYYVLIPAKEKARELYNGKRFGVAASTVSLAQVGCGREIVSSDKRQVHLNTLGVAAAIQTINRGVLKSTCSSKWAGQTS